MAPVRPSSQKAPSGQGAITSLNEGIFEDDFRTTKKDKRLIKHSLFVSKVAKSQKKTLKRRRPSKKLVANLDSLADALPDADEEDASELTNQVNIIKHKTLKHRPGAMKRKEKMEQIERDRFMKNMAQMTAMEPKTVKPQEETQTAAQSGPTSNRWAALRSFISQTMEHQPAFKSTK